MKQILQSYRSGELWLAEVPTSACKAGGLLVRTRNSLVSAGTEKMVIGMAKKSLLGKARARPDLVKQVIKRVKSDGLAPTLEKVFAKLDEPITLGYSAAGEVMEVGRNVPGFQPGDRVAIAGGGYATHAEFNYVPKNLCVAIPPQVSDEDASFATVGAIALQGIRQAQPLMGERIVVIGLGLLGLLTVQMLKANGCAVMGVDLDEKKVKLALELGADVAVSEQAEAACEAFSGGRGADAVIIAAATPSNAPLESAAAMSRLKGRIVAVGLVGLDVPRDEFYHKELDLRLSMSYGPGRYDTNYEEGGRDYPFSYVRFTEQRNLETFLYLVAEGKVTPSKLITHRFAFDDALDAYALLTGKPPQGANADPNYLGIVLEYPESAASQRVVKRPVAVATGKALLTEAQLGIGFVGAGGFARGVLLPELTRNKEVKLTSVCTTRGNTAQQTAESCGFARATTDLQSMLGDDETQAVFVVTNHNTHAKLACTALAAGKHVFVEKPMCLTAAEISDYEQALTEAREKGHAPCFTVGFNRRFSPHAKLLRDSFKTRNTPMVIAYRVNAGRIPTDHWVQDPEVGGGRIVGEACHFVDFCGFLVDSPPVRVHASSIASDRQDVVARDSVVISISYADGSMANIQYLAEGNAAMPKERVEVFAGGESAVMDNYSSTQVFGTHKSLKGRQAKGFHEELEAFVHACRHGGPWPIEWDSLVATQEVCLAALRSLETGASVTLGLSEARPATPARADDSKAQATPAEATSAA